MLFFAKYQLTIEVSSTVIAIIANAFVREGQKRDFFRRMLQGDRFFLISCTGVHFIAAVSANELLTRNP